jgi:hypothetical protein
MAETDQKSHCDACWFFEPPKEAIALDAYLREAGSSNSFEPVIVNGLCRRRAPVTDAGWPTVNVDDWCGDFHENSGKA